MNPDLSKKARDRIEAICEQGCTHVNQLLEKAANGDELEELSEFTHTETDLIISELDEIMSVYLEKDKS